MCRNTAVIFSSDTLIKFIFRFEVGDAYLGAISRFMSNAFEYGDALVPREEDADQKSSPVVANNQPYLNLATFVSVYGFLFDMI